MSRYKAYPEYVPSGVEFLDSLPVGWRTLRGKYVFSEYSERSESGEEQLLSVSEYYGVKPRGEVIEEGDFLSRAESLVGYKKCQKNDLVMNIMLAWKCGLGISKYDGIVSPAYSVFRFNGNASPDYMHYLLRTDTYTGHFKTRSTGVIDSRLRLYPESFGDVSLVLPSISEQEKIVAFLDHETAKIDALIGKQQRLIELLKEKRQAVISHAVTKGLNPNAPMKDSGVEWLGEVPAHWNVSRIKNIAQLESGHTPDKKIEEYWIDCNIPWVSLNDSTQLKAFDYITDTAFYLNDKGIANSSARKLPARCVVFTRDASIGLAAITTRVMAVSQHVIAWICDEEKVIPEYLLLVFYAMKDELERYTFGATLKTIGMADVKKLVGVFPSISEQQSIVENVFVAKEKFDFSVSKVEAAIQLSKERRTALISAAVTGKIDVRDWQAAA